MIKAIIIEDEAKAMQLMCDTLGELQMDISIAARLVSVRESIHYFINDGEGDIIFCDVQLPDGLSFEIFKHTQVNTPAIFTTCYDQFLLTAFENNGIDYLLKPVDRRSVEKALVKYKTLRQHFAQARNHHLATKLEALSSQKKKTRIIVKRGQENILLRLDDVVFFYTENKIVYAIDRQQKKYILDKNLGELEEELDNEFFFRANRKYIINLNYVKSYRPFEKVKLMIDLDAPLPNGPIIISQETAPVFRNWMRSV